MYKDMKLIAITSHNQMI